jgi:ankyrin repeat protein/mono/diheme cytochrome c family protein
MNIRRIPAWSTVALILGCAAVAAAEPVDFAREIKPLLQERCIACHGPGKQQGGYRLDRRSSALSGAMRRNIVPGSSAGSVLFHRVTRPAAGPPMPPKEPLAQADIDLLERWIDEGAVWPEALANDVVPPPPNAAVVRLNELIRLDDRKAALEEIRKQPSIVNERGPRGTTPLMYAALYGDATLLTAMLQAGADPNIRNDSGATALLWAIEDTEKVRLLLDRRADPNAMSAFGRTPLILATGLGRSERMVQLLLEHGATPIPPALAASAYRGNVAAVRLLLAAGVHDNGMAASVALRFNCVACLDAINSDRPVPPLARALLDAVPPAGPGDSQALLNALEHGADANAADPISRTVLMRAAISETVAPEVMQRLIDRGADVQVKDREGLTALDYARRVGREPVIHVLTKAGASMTTGAGPVPVLVTRNDARAAVARSIPLLQRTGIEFYKNGGCVSCHHNLLTAMTVATVRSRGFSVDNSAAREEHSMLASTIEAGRDATLLGASVPGGGGVTTTGYILMGLAAARHAPDATTDELIRALRLSQFPDGHWRSAFRPPSESSEITATAVSLRGLRLYARAQSKADKDAITAARSWLESSVPQNTEDRVFRLFGLSWAGASPALLKSAARDLVSTQRADGGWAQLPSLGSDAYATGSALVALHQAGVSVTSTDYRRGVQYLLKTQHADGSWLVKTRAHRTQVHFESGFPHGVHQFISAAGTNWATQAIALAVAPGARR